MKKYWGIYIAIYLSCIFIEWLLLGNLLTSPNDRAFSFGGDGFFIYYNMLQFICNGDGGLMLEGMNYPWFEYIFLTDAQAMISIVLNKLELIGLPICENAIGIIHLIIFLTIPLAAILTFKIFKKLDFSNLLAFIFSILITFLAPQMVRVTSHFGLAYLFLFPACIHWFLSYVEDYKFGIHEFLILVMITFFGLNNPYLGFMMCGFLGLATACIIYNNLKKKNSSVGWSSLLISIIPLLLMFVIVKLGDPFDDRLKLQWGFFHYRTDIQALLLGEGSLLRKLLGGWIDIKNLSFESRCNIGLSAAVILLIGLFLKWSKRKNWIYPLPLARGWYPLVISALCLYFYANAFYLQGAAEDFVEDKLGFLTMFKASGRFAWPLYYILTILAATIFSQVFRMLIKDKKYLAYCLLCIFVAIWTWEIHTFLATKYAKNNHGNTFSKEELSKLQAKLDAAGFERDKYQAMYTLPIMQGWNDIFYVPLDWQVHFHGLRYSFLTDLPIINAMVSRVSIGQSMKSMQLSSHYRIARELTEELGSQKDILMIYSKDHKILTEGENYLLDNSDILVDTKSYALYTLPFHVAEGMQTALPKETIDSLANVYIDPNWNHFEHFEDKSSEGIIGKASILKKGENYFDPIRIDEKTNGKYEFSIWIKINHERHGLPFWFMDILEKKGTVLESIHISSRDTRDFYKGWGRVKKEFEMSFEAYEIRLRGVTNQDVLIDEWVIKRKDAHSYYREDGSPIWMYGNYPMRLAD